MGKKFLSILEGTESFLKMGPTPSLILMEAIKFLGVGWTEQSFWGHQV